MFKKQVELSGESYFAVILFGMLGIAMVFSRVYQLCRIRFIWISIAFQFILAEISTMLKFLYTFQMVRRQKRLNGWVYFFLIVCATGVLFIFKQNFYPDDIFSMGQIEEKYGNFSS